MKPQPYERRHGPSDRALLLSCEVQRRLDTAARALNVSRDESASAWCWAEIRLTPIISAALPPTSPPSPHGFDVGVPCLAGPPDLLRLCRAGVYAI
jgi:hypothetical protein